MSRALKITLLVLFVLLIDQSLKVWVKTNMSYGDEIPLIGDWAILHFVENNGMAFGLSLGGDYGKLILSIFRLIAVGLLVFYIRELVRSSKVSFGLLASFGLILAGALGNIIDSAFYGLLFSASPMHGGDVATLFPPGGGYADFLHGKVVDMLYFPLFQGHFPDWLPFWGGEYFLFFRPVFNIADMAITIGVFSIILFHRQFFSPDKDTKPDNLTERAEPSVGPDTNQPDTIIDGSISSSSSSDKNA